ncbi:MAG TPA: hypothetical protein PLK58_08355 [Candidatus Rifleibacterium sp.]|nr:hypothetical protein [Candidatus Rifleibacterium sp.]HPW58640.1 hypothetical protein [Candidatus Rifleibacterium sp.]
MTRICEKFIEELTSGNRQFSTELREHLASCPDCQQAAENLSVLKTHRKPITGKEAASIAAVLKAVQTAEAAAATSATGSSTAAATPAAIAIPFKFVMLTLLAAAAAISIFINAELKKDLAATPPAHTEQQPAVSGNQSNTDPAGQAVSATGSEIIATETVSSYNSSGTINTASPGHQVEETTASTGTEVKMFSPDEEEISP